MKKFYPIIVFALLIFPLGFLSSVTAAAQEITSISAVQGAAFRSPLVDKKVTIRGVVTALRNSGFYVQTPDGEQDADPKTSEGIYVFTKEEPAREILVGSLVEVSGKVFEYRSEREPYALFLTEIIEPETKIIAAEAPLLPKPYVLTEKDLQPGGNPDQLERFEGMLVRIDELKIAAPTGGFAGGKENKVTSDGAFYGFLPKTPRPFREPGLDALKVIFDKLPAGYDVFDMNAELIRVDSDALTGGEPIDVAAGATVKNLVGVLDYAFGAYTLLLDPKIKPIVENDVKFIKASPAADSEITVASFNLENFFDDEENSDLEQKEEKVSAEFFEKRLKKTSLAIREVLSMPDVLGVTEVENLKVLQKLAEKINKDAESSGQTNPKYEAFLEEGNDPRGIDVGFLVKTSKIKVKKTEQIFKDQKLEHKDADSKEKLFDRPPLLIEAEFISEKPEENFAFTVIVNHLKSYRGIDDPKDGDRVRTKRRLQAEFLAKFVRERQKANADESLILIGDFNAFQFNDGFNDLIGILKGAPAKNIVNPSAKIFETNLVNLVEYISPENRYSYVFRGSAQTLDHILINKPTRSRAVKFGYARFNADFPKVYANDETRPERVSDHDVPVLYLSLKDKKEEKKTENSATVQKTKQVDCPAISVTTPKRFVSPGEVSTFTVKVNWGGNESSPLEYRWMVDRGEILDGQGTPTISFKHKNVGESVTGTVVITKGLPDPGLCLDTASEAAGILDKLKPNLIDDIGRSSLEDIEKRFKPFHSILLSDLTHTSYVINYGTPEQVAEREKIIRNLIFSKDPCPDCKIIFVNGGEKNEISTRLWIIPEGVDPSGID